MMICVDPIHSSIQLETNMSNMVSDESDSDAWSTTATCGCISTRQSDVEYIKCHRVARLVAESFPSARVYCIVQALAVKGPVFVAFQDVSSEEEMAEKFVAVAR